jgi:hypothetical protein
VIVERYHESATIAVEHSISDNNATLNIDYAPLAFKNRTELSIVIEREFTNINSKSKTPKSV